MTVLAKITLNESVDLDFGLEISGTDSKEMDIRLIIEGPDYGISCRCTESAGVITASIPKLHGILPAGTYASKLEIMLDGKYFQPLSENIQFVMPVTVGVSPTLAIKSAPINIRASGMGVQTHAPVVREAPIVRETPAVSSQKLARLEEMSNRIQEYEALLAKARKR